MDPNLLSHTIATSERLSKAHISFVQLKTSTHPLRSCTLWIRESNYTKKNLMAKHCLATSLRDEASIDRAACWRSRYHYYVIKDCDKHPKVCSNQTSYSSASICLLSNSNVAEIQMPIRVAVGSFHSCRISQVLHSNSIIYLMSLSSPFLCCLCCRDLAIHCSNLQPHDVVQRTASQHNICNLLYFSTCLPFFRATIPLLPVSQTCATSLISRWVQCFPLLDQRHQLSDAPPARPRSHAK
jgi:hypothetical protein